MLSDKLRKAVLQYAMQWKLTQQLESDSSVDELLNNISINTHINEEDVPYQIPDNWRWVKLWDISWLWKGEKKVGDNIYLEAKYLRWKAEWKVLKEWEFITKWTYVILVDWENSGEVFLVPIDWYMWSTFKVLDLNKYFNIQYVLNIIAFNKEFLRNNKKWAAIPHLNKDLFKNILVPVPPIEEQQRIVERVESLMKEIDELEKIEREREVIEKKFPTDIKNSILQYAIQWKLTQQLESDSSVDELLNNIKAEKERLIKEWKIKKEKPLALITDDEKPFEIPSNWRWVRLCDIYYVRSASRVHQSDWRKAWIPFYRAREIVSLTNKEEIKDALYIDEELYNKFSKSGVPKKWDIMISAVWTLWRMYIVNEWDKFYYKDASVLCFETYNLINSKFIKYFLESPEWIWQIYDWAMWTTVATLTIDRANKIVIPLPPIEEQQRIVDRVEWLMKLCGGLNTKIV